MARETVIGIKELKRQLGQLGADKKSVLRTKLKDIVKEAGTPSLTQAQEDAPLGHTGDLDDSIRLLEVETKGGNYTQVYFEDKPSFKKRIKNPGKYGGKKNDAYYPNSIEYGWKGANGKVYAPGESFVRKAGKKKRSIANRTIRKRLGQEIDKLIR